MGGVGGEMWQTSYDAWLLFVHTETTWYCVRRLRTKGHAPTRPTFVSGGSRCTGVLRSHPDTVRQAVCALCKHTKARAHTPYLCKRGLQVQWGSGVPSAE